MRHISERTLDAIKRVIDEKPVLRIVYMHADHFEPWHQGINRRYADNLIAFSEQLAKSDFTRRISFFYKPSVIYVIDENPELGAHLADEPIMFLPRAEDQVTMARAAMQALLRTGSHEINLHIHHEAFTLSDIKRPGEQVFDWLAKHSTPERDAARFELYLQLSLDAVRQETSLALDRWGFVHGNWALNASDHSICRITNEMMILQRNGCFGDFTFPAGRSQLNPRIEHPFTCVPVDLSRAYDSPEAEPRLVLSSTNAMAPGRFFIWSSIIKHSHCGIDYYSPSMQARLINTEDIVLRWIRDSVHFNGTTYIKTHSHSMARPYWEGLKAPLIPHLHPNVQTICSQLEEACQRLGIPLEFGTAQSIYDEFAAGSKIA